MALIAYWKFDDDVTDSSGSGFNLTASGSPTYTAGKKNNAVVLNGSSQYLEAASGSVLDQTTGDFSICGWIYRTADSGVQEYIIRKHGAGGTGAGYRIAINSNDKFFVSIQDASANQAEPIITTVIALNTWYFFAIVFDRDANATLYLYTESGLVETVSANMSAVGSVTNTTYIFTVGRSSTGSSNYFPGRIDELRFYSHALSSGEVTTIYNDVGVATSTKTFTYDALLKKTFTKTFTVDAVSEVAGPGSTTFQTMPIRTGSNSTPVNTQTTSSVLVTRPAEFNAAEFNPGEFNTVEIIAGTIDGPPFGLTLGSKSLGGVSKGQISQSAAQGSKSFSIAKNSEGS